MWRWAFHHTSCEAKPTDKRHIFFLLPIRLGNVLFAVALRMMARGWFWQWERHERAPICMMTEGWMEGAGE